MRHQFPKPPEAERLYPFCPDLVESEIHFLLNCTTFSAHRTPLLSLAENISPDCSELGEIEKLLMTEDTIIKTTAKYIRMAFEVREFLMRSQKCDG